MALKDKHNAGLDYKEFNDRLFLEQFNDGQQAMLRTRLDLLESFMLPSPKSFKIGSASTPPKSVKTKQEIAQKSEWYNNDDAKERAKIAVKGIWSFKPGSLTIVDLSCPFVDESAACAMFNICLALFLEDRTHAGRIVALDEAHKVGASLYSKTNARH